MTSVQLLSWRSAISAVVLLVAVHILFVATALAVFTSQTGDFGPPILGAVLIYVALFWLGVWIARKLSGSWLPTLAVVAILYGVVALALWRATASPAEQAFEPSRRFSAGTLIFWGLVAVTVHYVRSRRTSTRVTPAPP